MEEEVFEHLMEKFADWVDQLSFYEISHNEDLVQAIERVETKIKSTKTAYVGGSYV